MGRDFLSYCPKCGRRIYEEEKGCEFCGIVNDESLWEGVGGMKNQTNSLDYGLEEKQEELQKDILIKNIESEWEQTNQQIVQEETEGTDKKGLFQKGKVLSPFEKGSMIVMLLLIGPGGVLFGLVKGVILLRSPIESNRKFGKILLVVFTVTVILMSVAVWGSYLH